MKLTGVEAHYLLFALDAYLKTNWKGDVTIIPQGRYTYADWQALRDKLFAAHEHPEEELLPRGKERDEWKHEALEAMKLKR